MAVIGAGGTEGLEGMGWHMQSSSLPPGARGCRKVKDGRLASQG